MFEDGIVKEGSFNFDQGVGVCVQLGEKIGFVYSNVIIVEVLKQVVVVVCLIFCVGQNGSVQVFKVVVLVCLYVGENLLDVFSCVEKVELLKQIDVVICVFDFCIQQVMVSMVGVWEQILVVVSDGFLVVDICLLVCFNVSVIVEQNG